MENKQITKDGDIITITTEQVEVIDISALRHQLEILEAMPEPTMEEVLEMVKSGQEVFYYSDSRRFIIDGLKSQIENLENLQ
jgi:uncharacterized protein YqgV (UPF0045/DUF77 family)